MQGKKKYQEKLFTTIQLSRRVPSNNVYRKIKRLVDFKFIYKATKELYGNKGKASLDPVVFFKLCLIRHLENVSSDRKLMALCRIRLDLLFFIDYSLDEKLPAPTTVSHTKRIYPKELFDSIFNKLLEQIESI